MTMNPSTAESETVKPGRAARFSKRLAFVLAALVTLIAVFYAVENWRGKRAWEKYKRELVAKGEKFDWKTIIPARVPDDENFARTPLLIAIGYKGSVDTNVARRFVGVEQVPICGAFYGDYQNGKLVDFKAGQEYLRNNTNFSLAPLPQEPAADLIAALRQIEPEMNELRQAARRRYGQFPIQGDDPVSATIPNFVKLRLLAQLFSFHAAAELALRHPNEAFADAHVLQRLVDSLEDHPTLVSAMIRVAIAGLAMQSFWEGLATGQWTDEQLIAFQKHFQNANLLAGVDRALRGGERAGVNHIMDTYPSRRMAEVFRVGDKKATWRDWLFNACMTAAPRGWAYQNQLVYNRLMVETALGNYSVPEQRIDPGKCRTSADALNRALESKGPYYFLSRIAIPNFFKALLTTARNQTAMNQAAIACALERYHRAEGRFPENLDALTPRFIEKLPHDIIGGKPLHYRRTEDGKYLLYSIGWNETDEGGVGASDREKADWVWPFPEVKK
jgi:hypothetical protein